MRLFVTLTTFGVNKNNHLPYVNWGTYVVVDSIDESSASAKVYDKIARQYANSFDLDESDTAIAEAFLAQVQPKGSILDLGCGTGRLSAKYAIRDFNVTAIDLSREMVAIAKKKYTALPRVEFIQGDMRNLQFEPGSFQAVSFFYSLFHLNKRDAVDLLKKVKTWLTPGGVLLLVLQEGIGEEWVAEPFDPKLKLFVKLWTETEMREELEPLGFNVVEIMRKKPAIEGELPYNKLVLIAKLE